MAQLNSSSPDSRSFKMDELYKKYELGSQLGTGAFSEVRLGVERSNGRKFAVKMIDKSKCKGKEGMIDTEVQILQKVRHENIIQMFEMYENESKICLVMELVTGGELFDDIVKRGKYTEVDCARIIHKILSALNYLHDLGIVHRDLKPENLLLSDKSKKPKIMIGDFGLSKIFNDEEVMKTACGTPGYVAPEVLKRKGYGKEVDLWSLGVITYILLCGYPPFYDQNNIELFKLIMAGNYKFDKPWWNPISETAKDFIRKCLLVDPKDRQTAAEAIKHPFITSNCSDAATVSTEDVSAASPASTKAPAPAPENVGDNLAANVASNMKKAVSSMHSFKNLGDANVRAAEVAARTDEEPGRPLGEKTDGHDSGVITSRESVSSAKSAKSKGNFLGRWFGKSNKVAESNERSERRIEQANA
ncbi:calcium calmodulin-dependent protein kinase type 1G [Thoreauomyces humboldtii]|nr:calcium calmodulin-dependent protein kinase type 1G [Thoreauomyces humboldtii]